MEEKHQTSWKPYMAQVPRKEIKSPAMVWMPLWSTVKGWQKVIRVGRKKGKQLFSDPYEFSKLKERIFSSWNGRGLCSMGFYLLLSEERGEIGMPSLLLSSSALSSRWSCYQRDAFGVPVLPPFITAQFYKHRLFCVLCSALPPSLHSSSPWPPLALLR